MAITKPPATTNVTFTELMSDEKFYGYLKMYHFIATPSKINPRIIEYRAHDSVSDTNIHELRDETIVLLRDAFNEYAPDGFEFVEFKFVRKSLNPPKISHRPEEPIVCFYNDVSNVVAYNHGKDITNTTLGIRLRLALVCEYPRLNANYKTMLLVNIVRKPIKDPEFEMLEI
jgi:hypothetical protein